MTTPAPVVVIRLPEVIRRTGHPRSTLYNLVARKQFPQPIKLGVRAVGWVETEVSDYITHRIAEHRSNQRGAA